MTPLADINMPLSRPRPGRGELGLVVLVGLLAGLSYGLSYGDPWSNHPQYIIPGLRLLNPDFLQFDWWTVETTHFHDRFSWVVAGFAVLGVLPWALAIGNVLVIAATLTLVYALVRLLDQDRALQIWLFFILLFIGLIHTQSIAVSFFFSPSLQPSTLATLGYGGAILFFMKRRFFVSGIFLAFAGFMHTNYLILGFPLFALAHLALGRDGLFMRLLNQLALSLVVLSIEIPTIYTVMMGSNLPPVEKQEAGRIFMDSLPFHFRPRTFLWSFIPFIGWNLMALPHLKSAVREAPLRTAFIAIYVSFLVVIGGAALLTTVVFIDPVGRLQTLRLAPFALMFAQIIIASLAVQFFANPANIPSTLRSLPRLAISGLGAIMVVSYFLAVDDPLPSLDGFILLGVIGISAITWLLVRFRNVSIALPEKLKSKLILTIGLAVISVISFTDEIRPPLYNVVCPRCYLKQEQELFDWVRETDPQSIFLIPPVERKLEGFRLFGERAIVVDWRGLPHKPDEILEWYARMKIVTRFYAQKDTAILSDIARQYSVDYFVAPTKTDNPAAWGKALFQNPRYSVFRMPGLSHGKTLGPN